MSSNLLDQDFGSEEEDDDFNPVAADDSDAEQPKAVKSSRGNEGAEVDEDEGGDDDEAAGDANGDDDEEEDDEEEEEEEEEEAVGRPAKRRKGGGIQSFFEEEAGVDEEEDEVEDEEDELGEFGAEMHPDDLDIPPGAETDDRRHRELDRRRELDATMDAEKQAQMLKERYGRNRAAATDALVIPKRLLLPSVEDPSIWGCRVKPGKEREVVFAIQRRMEERPAGSRTPMRIISAFERGAVMQGWVYCEARRQVDVTEGLQGINFYYPSQKLTLVPVKEMPDLLRVQKSEDLVPGGWVRIKRGKYQNDLAQLEEVETNGLNVTVRLVPRLDYGMMDDVYDIDKAKRKRGFAVNHRPPQRLFNVSEAKKKHAKYLSSASGLGGKSWNYQNDLYVDGFLIKDMRVQHLITKNVNPRLEEVTMFARGGEDGAQNLDLATLAETMKNTTAEGAFQPGDPVEVYRGEQQGLIGRTESTRGDIVSLKVTDGDLAGQVIDAPVRTLRKRFREGDHVKVIGGSHNQNESGMVVSVEGDKVTLLSDMSMREITVFGKDLRLSADLTDGPVGKFDVHELVQLDPATVGCIIKVDRESLRVMDQNGSVRDVLPTQVTAVRERLNSEIVATDRNGAQIRLRDTVREVVRSRRSSLWPRSNQNEPCDGNEATRRPRRTRSPSPLPKGNTDVLIGKTVSVRKGRFKGLIGIVRDADDKIARVELYTMSSKHVLIPRDQLAPKHPISKQPLPLGRGRGPRVPYGSSGAPAGGAGGSGGGWNGGRTPIGAGDSSRTPAWGGSASARTPAWSGMSGSRTPAWKNDGSRTSNPYDGSRTAYGGVGNRTPAWNSGSRTPYDSGSGFDAFASGSRTPPGVVRVLETEPRHGEAFLTAVITAIMTMLLLLVETILPQPPAHTELPPPALPDSWCGAFNAPTPGGLPKRGGYDAPTPAAYDAPTPALGGAAPTPGAGYGDDDGGPRYDEGTPSP
ncbi:hypothetical protein N7470_010372 [Penicillium chermesinum]|nr:hypothetical protein N7470_010372 [Penicillium chermesinum]